jgi:hypothetical protein
LPLNCQWVCRVLCPCKGVGGVLHALAAAAIPTARISTDRKTATSVQRPGLAVLLAYARPGDTVVVHTLERLGYDRARVLFTRHTGWDLHQLRHSAATHLGEKGVPLQLIMAKTRHRNPRTAMRYVRPGAEAGAEVTALLEPPRRRGLTTIWRPGSATQAGGRVAPPAPARPWQALPDRRRSRLALSIARAAIQATELVW